VIERAALLADLQPLVATLEGDVRARIEADPDLARRLAAEHEAAVERGRTAMGFEPWRDAEVTQAAVGWVLGCVFVRFCEDNGLIDAPLLAGAPDPVHRTPVGERGDHAMAA
jgi:hypothetical protein